MLPLPTFNPLDTTKYPQGIGQMSVGAADSGSKILLYNESPVNLTLDFFNGNQSILHAWEARYWTLDGDTKQIEWYISASLNVTNPPISIIIGELYRPDEKVEGAYPMALIRQASVGNPGGLATTSSGTTIVNDGNAAGVSIIETTVSGQTSSSVTLTNDALMKLAVVVAGMLVQVLKTSTTDPLLQLGAVSHLVEILGNLTVDGNTTLTGTTTLTGAVTATNPANAIVASSVPGGGVTGTVANATNAASVPASGIRNGALPTGVTIAGSQVTSPVASATSATTATTANSANTVNDDVNLPGARLGTGAVGDMLDWTTTTAKINSVGSIESVINGVGKLHVDGNGIGLENGGKYYSSLTGMTAITGFLLGTITVNGGTTATITHNLGTTNYKVFCQCAASAGSTTHDVTSKNANTFTLYAYATNTFDWLLVVM